MGGYRMIYDNDNMITGVGDFNNADRRYPTHSAIGMSKRAHRKSGWIGAKEARDARKGYSPWNTGGAAYLPYTMPNSSTEAATVKTSTASDAAAKAVSLITQDWDDEKLKKRKLLGGLSSLSKKGLLGA